MKTDGNAPIQCNALVVRINLLKPNTTHKVPETSSPDTPNSASSAGWFSALGGTTAVAHRTAMVQPSGRTLREFSSERTPSFFLLHCLRVRPNKPLRLFLFGAGLRKVPLRGLWPLVAPLFRFHHAATNWIIKSKRRPKRSTVIGCSLLSIAATIAIGPVQLQFPGRVEGIHLKLLVEVSCSLRLPGKASSRQAERQPLHIVRITDFMYPGGIWINKDLEVVVLQVGIEACLVQVGRTCSKDARAKHWLARRRMNQAARIAGCKLELNTLGKPVRLGLALASGTNLTLPSPHVDPNMLATPFPFAHLENDTIVLAQRGPGLRLLQLGRHVEEPPKQGTQKGRGKVWQGAIASHPQLFTARAG